MLRPVLVRLPTRRKPFPRFTSPLSSSCTSSISPRIAPSITRQRRDSSSKPSSSAPPNGSESNPVSTGSDATTSRKRGSFSKASSRAKAKEPISRVSSIGAVESLSKKEEAYAIPSVPSTQHLHLQDIHLASLFAFHRPISVHHSLPQSVSNKRFGQIFQPRPSPPKIIADVISTISSTVNNMVKEVEKNHDGKIVDVVVVSDSKSNAAGFDHTKHEPNFITQQGTPMYIDYDMLVRNLPPHIPPPPPQPVKERSSRKVRVRASEVAKMEEFFTPSSIEMVEVFEPEEHTQSPRVPLQPFKERMRMRYLGWLERQQIDWLERRNGETLQAISVRRQRKLKMKKHKYKKLMKRTRNLRRRQDRL